MGILWDYFGNVLYTKNGYFLGIYWDSLGNMVGMCWECGLFDYFFD